MVLKVFLTLLLLVGPPVLFVLFFVVIFAPQVVADFLGPRLSAILLGLGLSATGVALGGWLWYTLSTQGRQGSWIGVLLAAGAAVGLIALGMSLALP